MNTNDMNITSFAQYVADSTQELAEINDADINTELTRYYLGCMEECGEVSAPEICMFSEGRAKLSAYDYNDEAESLDLFLFIHASSLMLRVDNRLQVSSRVLLSMSKTESTFQRRGERFLSRCSRCNQCCS